MNNILTFICYSSLTITFSVIADDQHVADGPTSGIVLPFTIVDTGQSKTYDADGRVIIPPVKGERFYGQDAQYAGTDFSYTDNGDGTVTDHNTGLMWQQTPFDELVSFKGAADYCEELEFAGYDDWRVPSAKESLSLTNFEPKKQLPYIDTEYFNFPPQLQPPTHKSASQENPDITRPPPPNNSGGAISKEQGQFWSSNYYKVGTTHGGAETGFGVNHYSGHIKGYPTSERNPSRGKHVRAVRGPSYLKNSFVDNGDGTVSDIATGLMWMQKDYEKSVTWEEALSYAETLEFAGYDDWRLPNVKQLHSIVDYSGVYPAVDPQFFHSSKAEDQHYFTWLWTNTSANYGDGADGSAWYVSFGKAVGLDGLDTHGAGAVRERPKYNGSVYSEAGDSFVCSLRAVRIIN